MGGSVSKAAGDVGSTIGNAIVAPLKSLFGRSCEDICAGTWDVVCFIEHLCVPDLVKLLLVCVLSYICLVFVYLLFKIGVCQCFTKCLCKMCWAGCETYWLTLDYICCFCWHKIRYTKRVYRGRRRRFHRHLSRDVELGYNSSTSAYSSDHIGDGAYDNVRGSSLVRKRKSRRVQSKRRMRSHRVKLRSGQVSVHLKGRSRRSGTRRRTQLKSFRASSLSKGRRNNSSKFKRRKIDNM